MHGTQAPAVVPDLLETLERIAAHAKATRERIAAGTTPKGSSALHAIENEARDAVRRAGNAAGGPKAARADYPEAVLGSRVERRAGESEGTG